MPEKTVLNKIFIQKLAEEFQHAALYLQLPLPPAEIPAAGNDPAKGRAILAFTKHYLAGVVAKLRALNRLTENSFVQLCRETASEVSATRNDKMEFWTALDLKQEAQNVFAQIAQQQRTASRGQTSEPSI